MHVINLKIIFDTGTCGTIENVFLHFSGFTHITTSSIILNIDICLEQIYNIRVLAVLGNLKIIISKFNICTEIFYSIQFVNIMQNWKNKSYLIIVLFTFISTRVGQLIDVVE